MYKKQTTDWQSIWFVTVLRVDSIVRSFSEDFSPVSLVKAEENLVNFVAVWFLNKPFTANMFEFIWFYCFHHERKLDAYSWKNDQMYWKTPEILILPISMSKVVFKADPPNLGPNS